MKAIQHIRGIRRFLQSPEHVMAHRRRSPTSAARRRWTTTGSRIRALLELPEDIELPSDPKKAHRRRPSPIRRSTRDAEAILRRYFKPDYEIIAACDRLRAAHGWNGEPPRRKLALKIALGG